MELVSQGLCRNPNVARMVSDNNNLATLNLNCTKMQLRDGLVFSPQTHHGQVFYHIECVDSASFYRIGYAEYVFISLLDGQTTFAEALALASQRLAAQSLTTQQATTIYLWLLEKGLGAFDDGEGNTNPFAAQMGRSKKGNSAIPNPFWIKVPLGNPDRLIRALLPGFAWLFSPISTALGLALMVAAAWTTATNWDQFLSASEILFSPRNWLWMTVAWIALKVVHELAHAFACRRYGGEVREVGMAFVLFAPLAYVDVTSSWRLPSKWSRIHVSIAGIYVELLVAAVAALMWQHAESKFASHMLYNLIVMASVSTILFNANPLMRFDGYFILSDLLEIPNLYAEGSKTVQRQINWFLFGSSARAQQIRSSGRWWGVVVVACYGWAAAVWRIVLCASLAIAASVLFHGAGVALTVLAAASWVGKPAWQFARSLATRYSSSPTQVWRALALSSLAVVVVGCGLFRMPSPATVSAPGVVEFQNVQNLRSLTGGFVRDVLVADGQHVVAGQRLLVLENPEVSTLYHDLCLEIKQTEVKYQAAVDRHETSDAQIAQRQIAALTEQLSEAQYRFESLDVKAPVSGKIIRRSLDQLLGAYLPEGEPMLSIGNENSKEVIVSIDQSHFDSVAPQVGQPVHFRTGSQARVTGKLVRVEPRASTRLIHPALSANQGGPLEVVPSGKRDAGQGGEFELAEPCFRAVISVPADCATTMFSGQRTTAMFGYRGESIGVTFYRTVSDWIKKKTAVALSSAANA